MTTTCRFQKTWVDILLFSNIRTDRSYVELKNGVEQTLNKIPVCGDRLVKGIRSTKQGLKQFLVPGMFFEEMGIKYLGPGGRTQHRQLMRVLRCKARGGGGDRPRGDEKRQGFWVRQSGCRQDFTGQSRLTRRPDCQMPDGKRRPIRMSSRRCV